jgi:hypothetical protein
MAFTGTQVIAMAQRFLVDIDDDAYGDDMLSYLNEACRRFGSETHCCQKVVDVAVTAQTIPFTDIVSAIGASAEQVLYVSKVILKTGTNYTPLPKAPVSEMKALLISTTTTPTRYSLFAESIIFDTHPDTTLSFTATIYCSFVPTDLAQEGDSILIPDEWVQAIVKYIVFCCRIADRDAGLANGAYQEFENIKQAAANVFIAQVESIPGAA